MAEDIKTYDASLDMFRPATQADFDALIRNAWASCDLAVCVKALGELRDGVIKGNVDHAVMRTLTTAIKAVVYGKA
jgi:hypothetical protein